MAVVVLIGARIVPVLNRFGAAINGLTNVKSWIEILVAVNDSLRAAHDTVVEPVHSDAPHQPLLSGDASRLENVSFHFIPAARNRRYVRPASSLSAAAPMPLPALRERANRLSLTLFSACFFSRVGKNLGRWRPSCRFRNPAVARMRIGYVPQTPMIADEFSAGQRRVRCPRKCGFDPDKLHKCIALAHLDDIIEELPQGLDTPLGDRGHRCFLAVSGNGLPSRARSITSPISWCSTEATSALDMLSERAIRDALVGIRGRVTTISIAHRFSTIEDSDQIFLMQDGDVVATGAYQKLLSENRLFAQLANPVAEIPAETEALTE